MSKEGFVLRFFWGPREESSAACAVRMNKFLKGLKAIDEVFTDWRTTGKRKSVELSGKTGQLQELLERGANRFEVPPFEPIRDLGFSLWVLSGGYAAASLDVHCGCYSEYVKNAVHLSPPTTGAAGRRLFRVPVLVETCKLVARCWEPDEGQVWSLRLHEAIKPSPSDIDVGWITYVSNRVRKLTSVPEMEVIPVKGHGSIIVTTSQRFSTDNPKHLQKAKALAALVNSPVELGR